MELLAQLLVSLSQRWDDERVLREIDYPTSPGIEVAERRLIWIVSPLSPGAVPPDHRRWRDRNRISQIDSADTTQAVGDHAALGCQLSLVPQMLEIRAATGEEGMGLLNAVGAGFEDIGDRCVRNAPVLTVDADSQPIARRGT
jgi:hypothetical protein